MKGNRGKRGGVGAYRKRSRFGVVVCQYCGNTFQPTRCDAKTCSVRCRVAMCRRDKKQMESGGKRFVIINTKAGRIEQEVFW